VLHWLKAIEKTESNERLPNECATPFKENSSNHQGRLPNVHIKVVTTSVPNCMSL